MNGALYSSAIVGCVHKLIQRMSRPTSICEKKQTIRPISLRESGKRVPRAKDWTDLTCSIWPGSSHHEAHGKRCPSDLTLNLLPHPIPPLPNSTARKLKQSHDILCAINLEHLPTRMSTIHMHHHTCLCHMWRSAKAIQKHPKLQYDSHPQPEEGLMNKKRRW